MLAAALQSPLGAEPCVCYRFYRTPKSFGERNLDLHLVCVNTLLSMMSLYGENRNISPVPSKNKAVNCAFSYYRSRDGFQYWGWGWGIFYILDWELGLANTATANSHNVTTSYVTTTPRRATHSV